ncbi:MAG: bifunctional hydroxymethylpyrimidine kinase/phosphomethylpyrimidine kinase [Candidatus Cloacimonetes bacterium]|jgi:hydroxymethylpyrimidine/phosphomethylpyrimidine kinase|nr:bifunctional hydroxymethylpyrimidine kinase/phosphomethylpyrimidine kinase [Candidatus Cloacimonadota bacterium]
MKYFLSIAASDSSGGAGIQQDNRIALQKKYRALNILTAVTAQNYEKVIDTSVVNDDIFAKQMEIIFSSFIINTIKIGVVSTINQAKIINNYIKNFKGFIVYDPVIKSSSGFDFSNNCIEIFNAITDGLNDNLIVTPNINELEVISDKSIVNKLDILNVLSSLKTLYKCSFYIKGGHFLNEQIMEFFYYKNEIYEFSFPRYEWIYSHGTGCAFSSILSINLTNSLNKLNMSQIINNSHNDLVNLFDDLNKKQAVT